ncbi:MAG: hypothetical protein H6739_26850 [Alphaproteobacteria bacterium]|nr:hypothetical protein [Alphaproteobacteria bacterium]
MAAATLEYQSTTPVQSSFSPGSNTTLPTSAASVPSVSVTVETGCNAFDVTISSEDLSGSADVEVFVDGEPVGSGTVNDATSLNIVGVEVACGSPHTVTVEWKQGTAGATLLSAGKFICTVASDEWQAGY